MKERNRNAEPPGLRSQDKYVRKAFGIERLVDIGQVGMSSRCDAACMTAMVATAQVGCKLLSTFHLSLSPVCAIMLGGTLRMACTPMMRHANVTTASIRPTCLMSETLTQRLLLRTSILERQQHSAGQRIKQLLDLVACSADPYLIQSGTGMHAPRTSFMLHSPYSYMDYDALTAQ